MGILPIKRDLNVICHQLTRGQLGNKDQSTSGPQTNVTSSNKRPATDSTGFPSFSDRVATDSTKKSPAEAETRPTKDQSISGQQTKSSSSKKRPATDSTNTVPTAVEARQVKVEKTGDGLQSMVNQPDVGDGQGSRPPKKLKRQQIKTENEGNAPGLDEGGNQGMKKGAQKTKSAVDANMNMTSTLKPLKPSNAKKRGPDANPSTISEPKTRSKKIKTDPDPELELPQIEFEDITAEVDARIKTREARLMGLTEKKRKRTSDGDDQAVAAGGGKGDLSVPKPMSKKSKTRDAGNGKEQKMQKGMKVEEKDAEEARGEEVPYFNQSEAFVVTTTVVSTRPKKYRNEPESPRVVIAKYHTMTKGTGMAKDSSDSKSPATNTDQLKSPAEKRKYETDTLQDLGLLKTRVNPEVFDEIMKKHDPYRTDFWKKRRLD